ncbi:hypothetical protein M422DRAFT_273898 [Sphaerobolus stellatus SS14]|uniref:Uncharacterized protein n=1 Tax=Sphaerobolus stellatus (strain SS14) TaxID=990650 RepID=A0A0C9UIS8_SPHS4|nr:hypothetical protein M422DRAFT_273898 [Sphaerobolus stellatus SS14]
MPQQHVSKIPTVAEALAHKSKITDRQKAIGFLEKEGYYERTGEELTIMTLSNILMVLSVSNNTDILKSGAPAIGVLMRTKVVEATINEITSGLESALEPLFMRLDRTTQRLGDATETLETFEKKIRENEHCKQENGQQGAPKSYAAVLRAEVPMMHHSNIIKNMLKDRQVLIDKHPDDTNFPMYNLEEEMILQKANMAVELMKSEDGFFKETEEEIMDGTFISVWKLSNSGIILETRTQKTATIIKERKSEFIMKLGERVVVKDRSITILVEFIPLTFNTEKTEDIAIAENDSKLPVGSIISARWIKPENRRKEGQKVAHLIIKYSEMEW